MASVTIQVATPDDWSAWRDVRLAALAESPDAFASTLGDWVHADEQRWRARLESVPCNVLAFEDGRPVGQASGTELDAARRVELISLWMAPDARGAGTADALVAAVVDHGRSVGAVAVQLSVRAANGRALAFYRKVGFARVDEPADAPDELMMRLDL